MINKRQTKQPLVLFFAGLLAANVSMATQYRFKDHNGATVLGTVVPPEYVKYGYEVLNDKGLVIKKVAPALTEEQKREQERLEKERQQQEEARQRDKELLRQYSHPDEIMRLWARKVDETNSFIKLKRDNIEVQTSKLESLLKKAANLQRSGKKVDEKLLDDIANVERKISVLHSEIAQAKSDLMTTSEEFQSKAKRLETLTNRQPTLTIPPLLE